MKSLKSALVFLLVVVSAAWAGVGESAVITLVFPPGARATGMGETFVAIADDINATFFNPAGLGQAPLANSWRYYLDGDGIEFTAIAARKKRAFEMRQEIWGGSNRGLWLYNGKTWSSAESYLIEEGDELVSIAKRRLSIESEDAVRKAVLAIRRENGLGSDKIDQITKLLNTELLDSLKNTEVAPTLAYDLLALDKYDRTIARVYGLVAARVDSARADSVAATILRTLELPGKELSDLVELKIPFSIAIDDSVTALSVDDSDNLWVGTRRGLWRYDGSSWKQYTMLDGLPSNSVTAIAQGEFGRVAVGTTRGVATFDDGRWNAYTIEDGLPDTSVTALAYGRDSTLFVGTGTGVLVMGGAQWIVYDTASGMLSSDVSALMYDSEGKLWIGGPNGISIFDKISWKRYKFPDSRVYRILEYQQDKVWIGTNRGAISYKSGRSKVDDNGKTIQQPPEWKAFHSKNALRGDIVRDITVHGRDVWLATDKAINCYNVAERQAFSFWEPLLPEFGIKDLWHLYAAFVLPTEDWGTIGFSANYINMGENEWTDELGRELGTVRSWETALGLSYGMGLTEKSSVGLTAKYIQSNLAPGIGKGDEGIGRTFAIDVGLLRRDFLNDKLDIGLQLQNMGPSIYYISRDQSDPIPFTVRVGAKYSFLETPVHDLLAALDLNRELVKNYFDKRPDPFWKAIYTDLFVIDDYDTLKTDKERDQARWEHTKTQFQEIQANFGVEYWYVNFLALRTGFLFDWIGERYEWTFGFGLKYGNLNVDWSYIYSPEGFLRGPLKKINSTKDGATGARDGQWRISLIGRF